MKQAPGKVRIFARVATLAAGFGGGLPAVLLAQSAEEA